MLSGVSQVDFQRQSWKWAQTEELWEVNSKKNALKATSFTLWSFDSCIPLILFRDAGVAGANPSWNWSPVHHFSLFSTSFMQTGRTHLLLGSLSEVFWLSGGRLKRTNEKLDITIDELNQETMTKLENKYIKLQLCARQSISDKTHATRSRGLQQRLPLI